jgi:hypothetical protein
MQYGNDMSMGILSGIANDLNVPYYEDGYGSAAYQNGRFGGQIGSTVTGAYLTADGIVKAVEGALLAGLGGGLTGGSGGSTSVVSVPMDRSWAWRGLGRRGRSRLWHWHTWAQLVQSGVVCERPTR